MKPQYVAGASSSNLRFAALESQPLWISFKTYNSAPPWDMIASGCAFAAGAVHGGKSGAPTPRPIAQKDRSRTCRTASRSWPHLAWLSSWQPVAVAPRKKNLWLSNPSPSRLSQRTRANTNKPVTGRKVRGVNFGPCPARTLFGGGVL